MSARDDLRDAIVRRLDELRPLLAELEALERALAAIDGKEPSPATASSPAGAPRTGSGRMSLAERQEQVLEVVRAEAGLTVTEIGRRIGVSRVRADQVVRRMIDDGALTRGDDGKIKPRRRA